MMIFRGVSRCNYAAAIAAMNTANCVEHGPTSEASSTPNFSKNISRILSNPMFRLPCSQDLFTCPYPHTD